MTPMATERFNSQRQMLFSQENENLFLTTNSEQEQEEGHVTTVSDTTSKQLHHFKRPSFFSFVATEILLIF